MRAWGRIAILIIGAGVAAGCLPAQLPPPGGGGTTTTTTTTTTAPPSLPDDAGTQAVLRKALGDEDYLRSNKVWTYTSVAATLRAFDPSIDWFGRLWVNTGDAIVAGDQRTVCVSETSPSGTTFELAEVALGPNGGKYTGVVSGGCPANDTSGANLAALGHHWAIQSAQADLQEGLVDEDGLRAANGAYEANDANLMAHDPVLDWGGRITVVVGDAVTAGDGATVCLSEMAADGNVYEIAKVARGANAGTYYGRAAVGCPAPDGSGANFNALGFTWADQAVQNDVTRALTDEDHVRADHGRYDSTTGNMKAVDPALDWGAALYLTVGDAVSAGDSATACLAEGSPTGKTFEIAEVATGANAGTYYGKSAAGCPANDGSGANLKALGTSW